MISDQPLILNSK